MDTNKYIEQFRKKKVSMNTCGCIKTVTSYVNHRLGVAKTYEACKHGNRESRSSEQ